MASCNAPLSFRRNDADKSRNWYLIHEFLQTSEKNILIGWVFHTFCIIWHYLNVLVSFSKIKQLKVDIFSSVTQVTLSCCSFVFGRSKLPLSSHGTTFLSQLVTLPCAIIHTDMQWQAWCCRRAVGYLAAGCDIHLHSFHITVTAASLHASSGWLGLTDNRLTCQCETLGDIANISSLNHLVQRLGLKSFFLKTGLWRFLEISAYLPICTWVKNRQTNKKVIITMLQRNMFRL